MCHVEWVQPQLDGPYASLLLGSLVLSVMAQVCFAFD